MNSRLLVEELKRDEGVRLKVYLDSRGIATIGVGRNLRDVGISEGEALALLEADIARTTADLDRTIPWWVTLDEVRQRVLMNMAFNLGVSGLLGFHQALAMVRAADYAGAAREMLISTWAEQTGPRAQRLSNMMRDGVVA